VRGRGRRASEPPLPPAPAPDVTARKGGRALARRVLADVHVRRGRERARP
jgi:hypothetical protein